MTNFTFGCDPEVFLKKRGKPVSALGLIPGDKKNPHKTDGGAIQVDGMAAEFNIDPVPMNDFETFNTRIVKQIKEIRGRAEGYNLNISPTQEFGKEFLDAQPKEAKELGCDPDYNAYTLKPNPMPDGERTFRTGAGHVHIGWGADIPVDNEEHIEICANFVKVLDATLGLFMTLIDDDPLRRELYGKAGAFRPKPYGVEYRTPSNVWIKHRDNRRAVFALLRYATWLATTKFPENTLPHMPIVRLIDNGNKVAAYEWLQKTLRTYVPNIRWGSRGAHQLDFEWMRNYILTKCKPEGVL
jgi:hypothetical protein